MRLRQRSRGPHVSAMAEPASCKTSYAVFSHQKHLHNDARASKKSFQEELPRRASKKSFQGTSGRRRSPAIPSALPLEKSDGERVRFKRGQMMMRSCGRPVAASGSHGPRLPREIGLRAGVFETSCILQNCFHTSSLGSLMIADRPKSVTYVAQA